MNDRPRVISSDRVFEGRIFNVRVDEVAYDDGGRQRLDVVEHGGSFAILATPAAGALHLVGAANSQRQVVNTRGLVPTQVRALLAASCAPRDDALLLAALDASGATQHVVIDATAARETAASHAAWLAAGYHVVSANKVASGEALAD